MALNQSDYDALVNYDRETGHLVEYDPSTCTVDSCSIDRLREQGTIQRLLDNELIHPTGKLTKMGLEEADRLERLKVAVPTKVEKTPKAEPPGQPRQANAVPESSIDDGGDFIAAYEAHAKETLEGKPEAKSPAEGVSTSARVLAKPTPAEGPQALEKVFEPVAVRTSRAKETGTPRVAATLRVETRSSLAYDEAKLDPNLVALLDPHSHEAEQFKILRTNILFPVAGQPPQSILVTSAAPEEGKTFTAANLAISIALNINKHVLLIDADLRRPQLHQRFGFGDVSGLSNYLADGTPLPSLLLKTRVDKLTLLPGGAPPENPSELISSERMAGLIAEVSSRYADRLIVIDAPPPALTAETGVLARQVDGIIIVVRFLRTRQEELADLIARVGAKKILGSVVNYMETATSRYYGYKYGSSCRRPKGNN
jgi:exopolysaccharide/PEP-CTERM locus tyrosine autokinase